MHLLVLTTNLNHLRMVLIVSLSIMRSRTTKMDKKIWSAQRCIDGHLMLTSANRCIESSLRGMSAKTDWISARLFSCFSTAYRICQR